MKNFNIRILPFFALCLILVFFSSGCVEIFQKIKVNKDGSGTANIDISIMKEFYPMMAAELKKDIPKGWTIVSEKDEGEKHVVSIKAQFKNLSELSDDEMKYTFLVNKKNIFMDSYSISLLMIKSISDPIPFEIILEVPGRIDKTNGTKISSNKVKWTHTGLPKGTMLFVDSSSFGKRFYIGLVLIGALLLAGIVLTIVLTRKSNVIQPAPKSKRIFCTQCGKENDSNSVFCIHCGQRI